MELPDIEITGDAWYRAVPPAAVPMPAAHMPPDLHGERAILTDPDVGVIYDLRVLGDIQYGGGRQRAAVVPELDYWRTKIYPSQPVHPRHVPLEHLYIEHRVPYTPPLPGETPPPQPRAADPGHLLRRLAPQPHQPGARTPMPARDAGNLHGRRIIQATPLGFAYDLRATSEPYENAQHDIVLRLTSAHEYYAWILAGIDPDPKEIGIWMLWTE